MINLFLILWLAMGAFSLSEYLVNEEEESKKNNWYANIKKKTIHFSVITFEHFFFCLKQLIFSFHAAFYWSEGMNAIWKEQCKLETAD